MTMQLLIIAALNAVILALVGLVLLIWRGERPTVLDSPGLLFGLFRGEYPQAICIDGWIAPDQRSGLVLLENGAVGVVEGAGRFWRIGMANADRVRGIDAAGEDRLRLRFGEFEWPGVRLRFAGRGDRDMWRDHIARAAGWPMKEGEGLHA